MDGCVGSAAVSARSIDGAPIVHIEIGILGSMEFLLKLVILQ